MRKLLLLVAVVLVTSSNPARAQFCPGVSPWVFDDIPASDPFCGFITWAAQRGITLGCAVIDANHRLYCPNEAVTRGQMAAFLSRLGNNNVFQQGGNAFGATAVLGTTDNNPVEVVVNSERTAQVRLATSPTHGTVPNITMGWKANSVLRNCVGGGNPLLCQSTEDAVGGVVAGGGYLANANAVTDSFGFVGGGAKNVAGNDNGDGSDSKYATVGGGFGNAASGYLGSVLGGLNNRATSYTSTVGGGEANVASGNVSTISGGIQNVASGNGSAVGGGGSNLASGLSSTVSGGSFNVASGAYSFAAGVRAKATQDRSFVWGGSDTVDTDAVGPGTFNVYAPGSIRFTTGAFGSGGCTLSPPNNGWTCASDRAIKTAVEPVDAARMLESVVALPVAQWEWSASPGVRHVGPMAQDFHAAFGLGIDDRMLAPMDVQGVALAAIQGLNAKVESQAREIADQRNEVAELKQAIEVLRTRTSPEGRIASAEVAPGLVATGRNGEAETVLHENLPPLLAEYQKQQRRIEAQARRIDVVEVERAALASEVAGLKADRAAQAAEIAELRRAVEVLLARTSPEGRIAAR